ncbi:DUF3150 domain-containing protein (plasmid) [Shewanella xiamenensis]|jgi:hypothetical protein|uniref:DUF3150 domain-containing protein n=1 Tax=Shewanella xiamenensis TaxID=332186 RepID=A0AAE4Q6D3_9GAMM|nr:MULTISPECIES: DUF3150 domain-containing protein [Shewanella]MCK7657724.1 DUF3150 domain-containing protein [Shewanella sp. JNE4-2]MCT8858058.1 DUF3150 domain-containing protein [Shewanella xiamenensis]MDH0451074.1 DUF3150 domain-containing protein [Shewanella sp. GD04112]MDV5393092.1 DUF3150 domain-containing protein [Shewanella xiamenensis]UWG66935.1 DUF3150 domain-containing protein [Shewanella xiamenensis]
MSIPFPKDYTVVFVTVNQWHAKRTLQSSMLGLDTEISKKIAHLGNLNSIDPESIKVFRNLSNQAHAACNKFGVKFGNGYLVPNAKLPWLNGQLNDIKTSFYAAKRDLITGYEKQISKWADEAEAVQAGFGKYVINTAYSKEYIDKQIQFSWHGMDEEINSLGNTLLDEVASKAQEKLDVLEEKIASKWGLRVSRKDLPILESIKSKLLANTLLDKRVQPIIDMIDELLDQTPEKGDLDMTFARKYLSVVKTLTQPQLIYGLNAIAVEPAESSEDDEVDITTEAEPVEATEPEPTTPVVTPTSMDWLDVF